MMHSEIKISESTDICPKALIFVQKRGIIEAKILPLWFGSFLSELRLYFSEL